MEILLADKTIGDFTAAVSVNDADLIELEQSGNSRKATVALLRARQFSGARVYKSADQTTADFTTATNLTFDSEHFDTDSYHDTGSNTDRLTVPADGYYVVTFQLNVSALTADVWLLGQTRRFNSANVEQATNTGTARIRTETGSTTMFLTGSTGPVFCTAGDYFTLQLQVETDNSVTVSATATSFAIHRLG
jgi:hypothetical protein